MILVVVGQGHVLVSRCGKFFSFLFIYIYVGLGWPGGHFLPSSRQPTVV